MTVTKIKDSSLSDIPPNSNWTLTLRSGVTQSGICHRMLVNTSVGRNICDGPKQVVVESESVIDFGLRSQSLTWCKSDSVIYYGATIQLVEISAVIQVSRKRRACRSCFEKMSINAYFHKRGNLRRIFSRLNQDYILLGRSSDLKSIKICQIPGVSRSLESSVRSAL